MPLDRLAKVGVQDAQIIFTKIRPITLGQFPRHCSNWFYIASLWAFATALLRWMYSTEHDGLDSPLISLIQAF